MGTISATMMTPKKTKKKIPDSFFGPLQHRFSPFHHHTFVRAMLACLLPLWLAAASLAAGPARPPQSSSSSGSHAHDFLIFSTVFTSQGFALYGAHMRVRRAGEKKYRWEAMSDHSGELAIRVPQNAQYEMMIEAKGFKAQTLRVDATQGARADLTIHMEPLAAAPSGPHAEPPAGGKP